MLAISDQSISFVVSINNISCYVATIYGSTSNIKRTNLWHELSSMLINFLGPWVYIGDFNAVLGAHEKIGGYLPLKQSCEDFSNWSV